MYMTINNKLKIFEKKLYLKIIGMWDPAMEVGIHASQLNFCTNETTNICYFDASKFSALNSVSLIRTKNEFLIILFFLGCTQVCNLEDFEDPQK